MSVPLPPSASVVRRGQLPAVLRAGEGGEGGCFGPLRAGAGGHPSALGREAGEPRGPHFAPQLQVWGGAQGLRPPGIVG